jgi:RHS repeat-associated protein
LLHRSDDLRDASGTSGPLRCGSYSYAASGHRLVTASNGHTTVVVYSGGRPIAKYVDGALESEYIYLGRQLLASYDGSGTLYYHHSDHLSVRMTTDASGNLMGEQGHYPYGEEWYMTNMTTNYVFTNYHRDDESGNDYAMHRYHVNRLGRFSTIDPLPRRGRNPQGLNRYSYAGNDPTGREDPSGMLDNLVCGPLGDCGGAGPSVGGDFGGDMAAGDPAVETGGSGPGGDDFFGCDPSDPFQPCSGYCSDLDPECYGCDPGFSVCDCDPIYGCEYWPKVGWAHYLEPAGVAQVRFWGRYPAPPVLSSRREAHFCALCLLLLRRRERSRRPPALAKGLDQGVRADCGASVPQSREPGGKRP